MRLGAGRADAPRNAATITVPRRRVRVRHDVVRGHRAPPPVPGALSAAGATVRSVVVRPARAAVAAAAAAGHGNQRAAVHRARRTASSSPRRAGAPRLVCPPHFGAIRRPLPLARPAAMRGAGFERAEGPAAGGAGGADAAVLGPGMLPPPVAIRQLPPHRLRIPASPCAGAARAADVRAAGVPADDAAEGDDGRGRKRGGRAPRWCAVWPAERDDARHEQLERQQGVILGYSPSTSAGQRQPAGPWRWRRCHRAVDAEGWHTFAFSPSQRAVSSLTASPPRRNRR